MVFRLVRRVSAVISLLMLLTILWLIYLLHYPHLSADKDYSIHHFSPPSSNINHVSSKDRNRSNSLMDAMKSHRLSSQDLNWTISDQRKSNTHTSLVSHLLSNASDFNNLDTKNGRDLLSRIKTNCKDRICSEFLTAKDAPHFKYCVRKTWSISVSKYTEPVNSECVFIDGSERYPMALASYPGSGNTWIRGLLQKVTGLCIGSIYCDVTLRQNGYPGESIRSGASFMVKTHRVDPRWEGVQYAPNAPFSYFKTVEHVPVYAGGVFIMRNPLHAMVAEFKRQAWESEADSHTRTLGREHFGNNTKWDRFVRTEALVWQETVLGWLVHNQNRPILVTKYEDMQVDTRGELERILAFLQVPYSRERLSVVMREGYGEYHRQNVVQFEHYTQSQKKFVREIVMSTSNTISDSNYVHIGDYLDFE